MLMMELQVQISKHGIGAPAARKSEDTGVNAAAKQGHGATGLAGLGGHVRSVEA